ncbi:MULTISPECIES: T3SS effector HopA1 family protein [unclassified Azospirillum]|uniref:T3SS effector HopA1 family protein n=1 Tax=unclassified Azospirillum TaxID=2630922 RepID=UPI000B6EA6DB|nr:MULTISPECIES: T3SS effector HopA1 family protein [unclassified Azospirillum]SNT12002.1 Phosphotransferase enzyme family protein [Azospirillum sp. RU38E]SNT26075.1 Phosphotransferase enzyme family protein [Azospirillum sp. RU37A]
MFLLASDVAPFLLSRALLTAEDVVSDRLRIREVRRRNRSFRISGIEGPGLFIKQVAAAAPDLAGSIGREAALHQMAATFPALSVLRGTTVALRRFEERRSALVFDLFGDAETLDAHYRRTRQTDQATMALLGAALAGIHTQAEPLAAHIADQIGAPRQPPWILTLGQRDMPLLGQGGAHLVAAIRATPTMLQGLQAALAGWRPVTLVHGDLKWDNILVREGAEKMPDLRIVDWELADLGDPLWDRAGVLAGFFSSWLVEDGGLPWMATPNAPPRPPLPIPLPPLQSMWPAMAAFWRGASGAGGSDISALRPVLPYLGARLLQSALESTFTSPTVPPLAAELVNLAGLAFAAPERFLAEFLDLSRVAEDAPPPRPVEANPAPPPAHGPADWADPSLVAVAEAVRILPPQSVQLSPLPPQPVSAPPGQDVRPSMVEALWPLLYQYAYTRRWDGNPAPPKQLDLTPDSTLVSRLSGANAGHSLLDRGWQIYQVAPDGRLHVEKGGGYRVVSAGQAGLPPGFQPQPGTLIDLRMPHQSLTAQAGYYHAFGETPASASEEGELARLYFNVGAEQAPALLHLLTLGLNRYFIPFSLKCPVAPALYDRVDTLVLYPPRRYLPLVLDVLDEAVPMIAPLLRPGEPLFTRRLLPGLGGADDPGTGESFGQSRCRLVAAGIIDAWSGGGTLLDCMGARLSGAGLRLEAPHLSPGLADLYRPLRGAP